jgi:hypothetical protein
MWPSSLPILLKFLVKLDKFPMMKVAKPLMNVISGYGQVNSSIANQIH